MPVGELGLGGNSRGKSDMNSIIYLIGAIVIVLAILSFLGLS